MVFHQTNRSPAKGGADRLGTYATQKLGRTPSRMSFPQANVAMILFVRRNLLSRERGELGFVGGLIFIFIFMIIIMVNCQCRCPGLIPYSFAARAKATENGVLHSG